MYNVSLYLLANTCNLNERVDQYNIGKLEKRVPYPAPNKLKHFV